ncbi:helix-turn-helix transcriptional regulator [Streptococcus suis]|uniref:helix-turn-helix domain-containing protein n=1 Tax=Streptococcus suis TaxID=1307 RepID=UPI000CF4CC66|nr:helix-turn-helix transcriptional regulator [Streptococcus suis]
MNRLKELRQEKKLSQKELAKKIGVHYRTLQNWENGESQIKPDKAQALADHFGVSVGYLLGYEEQSDKPLFTVDYSMLRTIEDINDIEEIDNLITDTLLANRILDRLVSTMSLSGFGDYNVVSQVMSWLLDFSDELHLRKLQLEKEKN